MSTIGPSNSILGIQTTEGFKPLTWDEKSPQLGQDQWLFLPQEIWLNVFGNLGPEGIDNLYRTCRKFLPLAREAAKNETLLDLTKFFPNSVLLREDWNRTGIPLADDVKILSAREKRFLISEFMKPCPHNEGKKRWQTQTLVEMPKGLLIDQLLHTTDGKKQPWIDCIFTAFRERGWEAGLAKTTFDFITNTVVVKGTEGPKIEEGKKKNEIRAKGYEFPSVFTAIAFNALKYQKTGERPYGIQYTLCAEKVDVGPYECRLVVGEFSEEGLSINYADDNSPFEMRALIGAAGALEDVLAPLEKEQEAEEALRQAFSPLPLHDQDEIE